MCIVQSDSERIKIKTIRQSNSRILFSMLTSKFSIKRENLPDAQKCISFEKAEKFVLVEEADEYWLLVINKEGNVGVVPKNYLESSTEDVGNGVTLEWTDRALQYLTNEETGDTGPEHASKLRKVRVFRERLLERYLTTLSSGDAQGEESGRRPGGDVPPVPPRVLVEPGRGSRRKAPAPPPDHTPPHNGDKTAVMEEVLKSFDATYQSNDGGDAAAAGDSLPSDWAVIGKEQITGDGHDDAGPTTGSGMDAVRKRLFMSNVYYAYQQQRQPQRVEQRLDGSRGGGEAEDIAALVDAVLSSLSELDLVSGDSRRVIDELRDHNRLLHGPLPETSEQHGVRWRERCMGCGQMSSGDAVSSSGAMSSSGAVSTSGALSTGGAVPTGGAVFTGNTVSSSGGTVSTSSTVSSGGGERVVAALDTVLSTLCSVKEDSEQRNWPIYEDEAIITGAVITLTRILGESKDQAALYFRTSTDDNLDMLVKYFQMECRSRIVSRLFAMFTALCDLGDPGVTAALANTTLITQLAQRVLDYTHEGNDERVLTTVHLLTRLLTTTGNLPLDHFYYVNTEFFTHLVSLVEGEQCSDELIEGVIHLLLVFNLLHHNEGCGLVECQDGGGVKCEDGGGVKCEDGGAKCEDDGVKCEEEDSARPRSLILNALSTCDLTAKTLTNRLVEILNREVDPVAALLSQQQDAGCSDDAAGITQPVSAAAAPRPHSVMKLLEDMLGDRRVASRHFYTNDTLVLVDVVLRRLTDLSPRHPLRYQYLSLLHTLLGSAACADYSDHKHRGSEIERLLNDITREEEETTADQPQSANLHHMETYIAKSILTDYAHHLTTTTN